MDKRLNNLGLAKRAGKVLTGTDTVVEGLRNNEVALVFLATDTAINTSKRVLDKSKTYNVEVIQAFTSAELSAALGKINCHVVGIIDRGFAKLLKE